MDIKHRKRSSWRLAAERHPPQVARCFQQQETKFSKGQLFLPVFPYFFKSSWMNLRDIQLQLSGMYMVQIIFRNSLCVDDTCQHVMWAGIQNAKRHAQGYIEDKHRPRSSQLDFRHLEYIMKKTMTHKNKETHPLNVPWNSSPILILAELQTIQFIAGLYTFPPRFNGHFRNLNWRYLPDIRPIFQAYVREYTHTILPNIWY